MENIKQYNELVEEINSYRSRTKKIEDLYVYKSHQIIVTCYDESYYSMLHEYQLNGVINILNSYSHIEGLKIQIYEIGRTVFRNF